MDVNQSIANWVAALERELVEADINVQLAQSRQWARFTELPDSEHLDVNLLEGWMPDRQLDWSTITMELYLIPVKKGFFRRIMPALRWMFTGKYPVNMQDLTYLLAHQNQKNALGMKVVFTKNQGAIQHQIEMNSSPSMI